MRFIDIEDKRPLMFGAQKLKNIQKHYRNYLLIKKEWIILTSIVVYGEN